MEYGVGFVVIHAAALGAGDRGVQYAAIFTWGGRHSTPSSDDRAVLSIAVLIGPPSHFLSTPRISLSLLKYYTLGSVADVEA